MTRLPLRDYGEGLWAALRVNGGINSVCWFSFFRCSFSFILASASPALAQIVTDKGLTVSRTPAIVEPGENITYTFTLTNHGPDAAPNVRWSPSMPNNTTFVSLDAPAGWDLDHPAVGGSGYIDAESPLMANGEVAVFTLVLRVHPAVTTGTVLTASAGVNSNNDPDQSNNWVSIQTTVGTADLSIDDDRRARSGRARHRADVLHHGL